MEKFNPEEIEKPSIQPVEGEEGTFEIGAFNGQDTDAEMAKAIKVAQLKKRYDGSTSQEDGIKVVDLDAKDVPEIPPIFTPRRKPESDQEIAA